MQELFNSISGFKVKEYISKKDELSGIKTYKDVDFCINFKYDKPAADEKSFTA